MGLEELFSNFSGSKKPLVHLSMTPSSGLELLQIDMATRTIVKYAQRPLAYNEALRELSDIDAFKYAVIELFNELNIDLKCNIILNIPMVLFGSKELALMLGDDSITEALTSEAEQSYVFKRHEPLLAWFDSNASKSNEVRKLFYSAVQKKMIDQLKDVLSSLGATLLNIDVSLSSLLKALMFCGLIEEQTRDGISWNLMVINSSGYSLCSMLGKNIIDYYEEPLAIKSFENDEIYNAINASAQITLMSYPANYLYIVSETDIVSAELLAKKIQVDCSVDYCENNCYKKRDYLPVSLDILEDNARLISLQAIGCCVGNSVDLSLKFNFLGKASGDILEDPNEPVRVVLGGSEFDISPNGARNFAALFALIILLPFFIAMLALPMAVKSKQNLLDDVTSRLETIENEIKTIQKEQNRTPNFDVNSEIKKVLKDNRAKLMAYTALGESVPGQLWLTYFIAKDDGKFNIKGRASNVEDVYSFFRNMKDSLINTKLRIHKLEMLSSSVEEAVNVGSQNGYEFEITNMTNVELNPTAVPTVPVEPKKTDQKKPVDLLNKPLLNLGKE